MTTSAAQALTGEPAAPATASASTPEPAASGDKWFTGIQNEDARTWAEAKGWKDPYSAVESGYHLEKLMGFEKAGRTLVVPGEDATPEQRAEFNSKLGVPSNADDYKLSEIPGSDPEFSKVASDWFHKNGVSSKAAQEIVKNYNEYSAQAEKAKAEQRNIKSEADFNGLKTEWGAAFEEKIELGRRMMNECLPKGTQEERGKMLQAIEDAIGSANLLRFAAAAGAGLGEHKMHMGQGQGSLTPAQAKQRINELKTNQEWVKSYIGGDAAKAKEMQSLHEMAYHGE